MMPIRANDEFKMNDSNPLEIYLGIILIVVGCVIHFGGKFIPFGSLPGDIINVEGENSSFHFPIVTCIIISVVLSVIANLIF